MKGLVQTPKCVQIQGNLQQSSEMGRTWEIKISFLSVQIPVFRILYLQDKFLRIITQKHAQSRHAFLTRR